MAASSVKSGSLLYILMSTFPSRCFVVQVQGWNEPHERVSGHFLLIAYATIAGIAVLRPFCENAPTVVVIP